jgi:hypothetical protein
MSRLLDYAAIRRQIPLTRVLGLIGWEPISRRGPQWRGFCPLGCSSSRDPRQDPCFSVHVERHLFQCFHCRRAGDQLNLWAAFLGQPLYPAILQLCHQLAIPPLFLTNPQPQNRV